MDKKDKKLLIELIINSRIPINQLAKKIGVSREVATYRLNRLIKNKTILSFYPIIDIEALGYLRYGCFVQLKLISQKQEKEFIEFLVNHKFITYISPIIGKWNVVFDILAKNKEHLQKILQEISNKLGNKLETYAIIPLSEELMYFPSKIVGIKKEINGMYI